MSKQQISSPVVRALRFRRVHHEVRVGAAAPAPGGRLVPRPRARAHPRLCHLVLGGRPLQALPHRRLPGPLPVLRLQPGGLPQAQGPRATPHCESRLALLHLMSRRQPEEGRAWLSMLMPLALRSVSWWSYGLVPQSHWPKRDKTLCTRHTPRLLGVGDFHTLFDPVTKYGQSCRLPYEPRAGVDFPIDGVGSCLVRQNFGGGEFVATPKLMGSLFFLHLASNSAILGMLAPNLATFEIFNSKLSYFPWSLTMLKIA